MRALWRNRLYWLGLGIGLLFFVGQIFKGYQVFSTITLDAALLVRLGGAVATGLLALGLQMVAWRFLMRDLGVPLTWRSVISGYMLSFLPRYIPGSVWGYLSRSEWLKRTYGVPYALSSIGSVLEISIALVTGSAVIGFYYLLNTSGIIQFELLCFEVGLPVISWLLLNFALQLDFVKRRYAHGLQGVNFSVWAKAFAIYIMLWICYGVLTLILVGQFYSPLSISPLVSATFSFCISWLIGFLVIFSPSGLGIREIALSNVLAKVMGVPLDAASAISVISRLCIACAEILWVSIGIMYSRGGKSTRQPIGNREINPS